MSRLLSAYLTLSAILFTASSLPAEPVAPRSLFTRKVGKVVYFEVVLTAPADYSKQRPRLVPLDKQTRDIVFDLEDQREQVVPLSIRFQGIRDAAAGPARLRLDYTGKGKGAEGSVSLEVRLDWAKADSLDDLPWLDRSDVPGRWANSRRAAEKERLAELQALEQAKAARRAAPLERFRTHGVPGVVHLLHEWKHGRRKPRPDVPLSSPRDSVGWRLPWGAGANPIFELLTGAAALDESLMSQHSPHSPRHWAGWPNKRMWDVADLRGIDIAEHPWKKMMGDRRPAPEPLAGLVPHDNWYLTMADAATFARSWEVLDTWGGSVLRPPALLDRDHGLRARYERQLGLPSAEVVKALPAGLVEAIALTGSDLFWLSGSDVTALIQVKAVAPFLKIHDAHIARTGPAVAHSTEKHAGVAIDAWTTPDGELRLHRATIGNVAVCSNSPTAIRHIVDVHAGRRKALADALDFRYMRTAFPRDDKAEDGFVFLSDAFVRRLMSPATRIKESRRQAARANLHLAGAAAVFAAMETGKLPGSVEELLTASGLPPDALALPGGEAIGWDRKATRAVSNVYGTVAFSTPLLEVPIDRVLDSERLEYEAFRGEYLRLWRRYFDPVGIRFKLGPGPMRVEVYLLPLVNNSAYNELRRLAGGGTVKYSPSRIPNTTALRLLTRLSPEHEWVKGTGIGDWGFVQIDGDDPDLGLLVGVLLQLLDGRLLAAGRAFLQEEVLLHYLAMVLEQPILLGLGVKDGARFRAWFEELIQAPSIPRPKESTYRGVRLRTWGASEGGARSIHSHASPIAHSFGVSTKRPLLERFIDQTLDEAKPKDLVEVNASLYLAPPGGKNLEAISKLLEWQTHRQALSALATWQMLHRTGVVRAGQSDAEKAATVRGLLGYVPASPDGSAFRYDERSREMSNARHGTLRKPTFQRALAPEAQVLKLLRELRSLRVDLRFREDGIHTVLTLDWAGK